jgi:DNA-binding transcriptional MocR family regulator
MTIWNPELGRAPGPVYRAIARVLEADVRGGKLEPGAQLPTHRALAGWLGVNVGTVSRAYAECEKGGWIRGEVGRGTFVRGRGSSRSDDGPAGSASAAPGSVIDLSANVPVASPGPDVASALRALAAEATDTAEGEWLGYRPPEGSLRDREAGRIVLAAHGVRVRAEDVVLCAGAQHGLHASLAAVCRPGETVAVEELAYPGFRAAADARGLCVVPVEMDAQGLLPESLEAVCDTSRPRALYLSPTVQNPTCSTLPLSRRQQIADIAQRRDVVIVEDDIHRMLAPEAPPPVSSLAPQTSIYIASLSKCLAPGLRVGYLAVPEALRARVVEQVWGSIWMVSPLTAALASLWVDDGSFERVAAGRRAEALRRQQLAVEILCGLPGDFRLRTARVGYHVWLELGAGWNATAFANATRERGVLVSPATAFFLGRGGAPHAVRISLSGASDRARLAAALGVLVEVACGATRTRIRL